MNLDPKHLLRARDGAFGRRLRIKQLLRIGSVNSVGNGRVVLGLSPLGKVAPVRKQPFHRENC